MSELNPKPKPKTPRPKILWHRLLQRLFQLLLTPVGLSVLTEAAVMTDSPKIDVLVIRREGKSNGGSAQA